MWVRVAAQGEVVQHGAARRSRASLSATIASSAAQRSTAQRSTAQRSTAQRSAAHPLTKAPPVLRPRGRRLLRAARTPPPPSCAAQRAGQAQQGQGRATGERRQWRERHTVAEPGCRPGVGTCACASQHGPIPVTSAWSRWGIQTHRRPSHGRGRPGAGQSQAQLPGRGGKMRGGAVGTCPKTGVHGMQAGGAGSHARGAAGTRPGERTQGTYPSSARPPSSCPSGAPRPPPLPPPPLHPTIQTPRRPLRADKAGRRPANVCGTPIARRQVAGHLFGRATGQGRAATPAGAAPADTCSAALPFLPVLLPHSYIIDVSLLCTV